MLAPLLYLSGQSYKHLKEGASEIAKKSIIEGQNKRIHIKG